MTREEADFIGAMNMCDEISNEAYKKIMCHCEEQQPCEDCVSRAEVVELFEFYQNNIIKLHATAEDLLFDLQALPSVNPQPRWIPVSECQPNETGIYIATVKYGDKYAVGQRYYHGQYVGWEDSCVIAWMLFPEPYKEGIRNECKTKSKEAEERA